MRVYTMKLSELPRLVTGAASRFPKPPTPAKQRPMLSLTNFPPVLLVMIGGGFGAAMRYLVGRWTFETLGPGLPFGTWGVNILGGLLMGMLVGWLALRGDGGEPLRLLLGVGVLGGFTTFSAFSLEVVQMILRGDVGLAGAYAVSSVAGSVVALYCGTLLVRSA